MDLYLRVFYVVGTNLLVYSIKKSFDGIEGGEEDYLLGRRSY